MSETEMLKYTNVLPYLYWGLELSLHVLSFELNHKPCKGGN